MYRIKEAIIVEGVYDKNRLLSFIDATVITTHGFAVYTNDEYLSAIKQLAEKCGVVILTDSDSAGMRIRNFIKQAIPSGAVKHAYIPDIKGVEKRKRKPSAEGFLGVEGMTEEIIIKALRDAGCTIDGVEAAGERGAMTKSDLYRLGLSGCSYSSQLRRRLAAHMGLPSNLSANMLLDMLNRLVSYEEVAKTVENLKKDLTKTK